MQSNTAFLSTINKLKQALQLELPGKDFQLKMIPLNRRIKVNRKSFTNAAVLILLYERNNTTYTVFIERTLDKSAHSGQVSLPGGRYEDIDKNSVNTAIRETEEEVGVNSNDVTIIGQLTKLKIEVSGFNVQPVIGYLNDTPNFIPSPCEVKEIIECSIDDLFASTNKCFKEISIGSIKIKTPCYLAGDKIIWGATAMILREFEEIIKRPL